MAILAPPDRGLLDVVEFEPDFESPPVVDPRRPCVAVGTAEEVNELVAADVVLACVMVAPIRSELWTAAGAELMTDVGCCATTTEPVTPAATRVSVHSFCSAGAVLQA
jgi:hypothetical protein